MRSAPWGLVLAAVPFIISGGHILFPPRRVALAETNAVEPSPSRLLSWAKSNSARTFPSSPRPRLSLIDRRVGVKHRGL
jgi:hypothetical protein